MNLHPIISKLLKKTSNLYDKLKAGKDYAEDEREQIELLASTIKGLEVEKDYYENENYRSKDNTKIYNNRNARTKKRRK